MNPALARRAPGALLVAATSAAGAVLMTAVMYRAGPMVALVIPVAIAVVAAIAWRPMLGVLGFVLAIPLEGIALPAGGSSVTPAEGLILLTGAMAAAHLALGARGRFHLVQIAFLAMILVAATGFAFAPDTAVLFRIVRIWVALFFVLWAVARADLREVERLLKALAISAGVVGVLAVVLTGPQQVHAGGEQIEGRAQAGFAQPQVLGMFLILALPATIMLALRSQGAWRWVFAACAGTELVGLALSLSRSAMIGLAFGLLVLLAHPAFRRVALGILVVLLLLLAGGSRAIERSQEATIIAERFQTLGSGSSGTAGGGRLGIYRTAPSIIADHPVFGVGEGNFSQYSARYGLLEAGRPFNHAHNMLLTFAIELGLVGFAAFLALLVGVWRSARRGLRGEHRPLALGVVSGLVALFVCALFEYPPRTNVLMGVLIVLLGTLVAFEGSTERS